MKLQVTLTQEQWALIRNTYGRSAVPQNTDEERKHLRLYTFLIDQLRRDEEPLTVDVSPGQRARLLQVMRFPTAPWATAAMELIKPIWVALGWIDDLDNEGDDE